MRILIFVKFIFINADSQQ